MMLIQPYLELGSPKELTAEQVAKLNDLTRNLPETDKVVRSAKDGTFALTSSMNSNDTMLVKLVRSYESK